MQGETNRTAAEVPCLNAGVASQQENCSLAKHKHKPRLVYSIIETSIQDKPRFQHRGLLIDTARHFLPVPIILVSYLSSYRTNIPRFRCPLGKPQSRRFAGIVSASQVIVSARFQDSLWTLVVVVDGFSRLVHFVLAWDNVKASCLCSPCL